MDTSESLIRTFYGAFAARDAAGMGQCYADDARFHDPVFGDLDAEQARAMWRMLLERGEDLEVRLVRVEADGERASAGWEADYTFRATGRMVHNVVEATFRFREGRIVEHRDRFSLWRWTRMALGIKGTLLGWTPLVQGKVRSTAAKGLGAFLKAGK